MSASAGEEGLRRVAQRELVDEIAAARARRRGDEVAAQLAHHRLRLFHGAWREPRVEDAPVLDVVGRIDLRRDEAVDRLRLPRSERLAREDLRSLVDVLHRVVARKDPVALREGVEVDGAALAQLVGPVPVGPDRTLAGEVLVHDRAAAELAPARSGYDGIINRHGSLSSVQDRLL
jgi:hypothetical protein